MKFRFALILLAAIATAACGGATSDVDTVQARPAVWEIAGTDGSAKGWMMGTIHALPDGIEWRSELLDDRLDASDVLVVEVAGLGDDAKLSALFESMAFGDADTPIASRIDPGLRDELDELVAKARTGLRYFDTMESWAAALALAQVAQTGSAENGVDRALLGDFEGREIVELEGAQSQLAIFDTLPEREQRDLLEAVLMETGDYEKQAGLMAKSWQNGDVEALAKLTRQGILADPELKSALLTDRNRAWAAQIENLLSTSARPFVAVGAGHLLGPEGLPALLEARGYTVRRIQ